MLCLIVSKGLAPNSDILLSAQVLVKGVMIDCHAWWSSPYRENEWTELRPSSFSQAPDIYIHMIWFEYLKY